MSLWGTISWSSRSDTAARLWNVERSRVVLPGLTASEWPETDYSRGNVVMLRPWDHARFYNCRRGNR